MKLLSPLTRTAALALRAASESFSPPPSATSRSIRINGGICLLLGFASMLACGALMLLLKAGPSVLLLPSLLAYAFFAVGGYRLIRGKEPRAAQAGEVSLSRIFLGCASVVFCGAMLVSLGFLAGWILGK